MAQARGQGPCLGRNVKFFWNRFLYIIILADRWSRTNPNFAQTQTSNKPKVRKNLNFEQTKKFLALGGLRIIRPWGDLE